MDIQTKGIISLHPKYAVSILEQRKKVEWRKRNSFYNMEDVAKVFGLEPIAFLTYITAPIKSPMMILEFSSICVGDPIKLFEKYQHVAGISFADLIEYYSKIPITEDWLRDITMASGYKLQLSDAYAMHISSCYIITANEASRLRKELQDKKLPVLKGLRSVQLLELDIDNDSIVRIW